MFEFNPEKFENNYSTPVETKDGKSVLIVAQSFEDEQCKIDLVIGRIENSLELVEWKLVDNCYVPGGTDVDQAAPDAVIDHMTGGVTHHHHVSPQVEADQVIKVVHGDVLQRQGNVHTGVVDQQVQPAKA